MKNIQITIEESLLADLDRCARPMGRKRSAVIREAVREWLRRREAMRFEQEWIAALQSSTDDRPDPDTNAWSDAEAWEEV